MSATNRCAIGPGCGRGGADRRPALEVSVIASIRRAPVRGGFCPVRLRRARTASATAMLSLPHAIAKLLAAGAFRSFRLDATRTGD
jgi:hypothetical protein